MPGYRIERGLGSFDVRGMAVRIIEHPDHVPIGLLENAVVTKRIDRGHQVTFDDVELPNTLALRAWRHIQRTSIEAVLKARS